MLGSETSWYLAELLPCFSRFVARNYSFLSRHHVLFEGRRTRRNFIHRQESTQNRRAAVLVQIPHRRHKLRTDHQNVNTSDWTSWASNDVVAALSNIIYEQPQGFAGNPVNIYPPETNRKSGWQGANIYNLINLRGRLEEGKITRFKFIRGKYMCRSRSVFDDEVSRTQETGSEQSIAFSRLQRNLTTLVRGRNIGDTSPNSLSKDNVEVSSEWTHRVRESHKITESESVYDF